MNEPIRILYFVDRMLRGGIQSLVIDWVSRFDKNKVSVDFLLLDDGKKYELEDILKALGCNVFKLKGIWIKRPTDFMREAKALDNFFKEHHDYKVIHMHSSSKNYMVLKYAKKYKIPVRIAHSHNIDFQSKNPIKKFVGNVMKKELIKYTTDYFACSELAGKWLFGKKIIKSEKFKIIHNAIDLERFKFNNEIRNKIRKELKIENKYVIGHVGRFTNQKNHTFLIDIFNEIHKENSDAVLLLIGIGEKQNQIKEKILQLKLENNIIFLGFKNNVNEYMWAMDLFLFPSLYEGLGLVLIEAQATGLKCFTSKDVIPKEVKVSDQIEFISLEDTAKKWAIEIKNQNNERKDVIRKIKECGYDIYDTVLILEDFYCKKD